jgi:hypothetical protein
MQEEDEDITCGLREQKVREDGGIRSIERQEDGGR